MIVELRRYVMRPGRRDELINLFERHFLDGQRRCGIEVLGCYRDLDDPQLFVWLRRFPDMESRKHALEAFYIESTAWREHRDAANATMIDSDNVLLLRPAPAQSDVNFMSGPLLALAIFMLAAPANGQPAQLQALPAETVAFVTANEPNTFARLPVREGEWALVAAANCRDTAQVRTWNAEVQAALPESLRATIIATEYHRLEPCARSVLH